MPNPVFQKHVFVCVTGKTCPGQGSEEVLAALRKEIASLGLKKQIRINKAGCFDHCGNGPLVIVYPDQIWYAQVQASDCKEIVQSHLLGDRPVERLLYDGRGKIV
jgi:(2Fe-2S) ferredoxin